MTKEPPLAVRLLAEQRRRCVATLLSSAENQSWWERLSANQQEQFRNSVRTTIQVFYDFTRDVLKVTDEDSVRSELALELIRSIHSQNGEIARLVKER